MNRPQVLTIGHSNHPIETFIALLKQHGVTALADVRSVPYSRRNPQFGRDALRRELQAQGIAYVFLGKELGARTEDPSCYQDGQVVFARLAATPLFRSGLQRVMSGAQTHRLALMCAERAPLDCHRTLLVSQALAAQGVPVGHILADGSLEAHAETLRRLPEMVGVAGDDLFRSEDERIAEACAQQEKKIAYLRDQDDI